MRYDIIGLSIYCFQKSSIALIHQKYRSAFKGLIKCRHKLFSNFVMSEGNLLKLHWMPRWFNLSTRAPAKSTSITQGTFRILLVKHACAVGHQEKHCTTSRICLSMFLTYSKAFFC